MWRQVILFFYRINILYSALDTSCNLHHSIVEWCNPNPVLVHQPVKTTIHSAMHVSFFTVNISKAAQSLLAIWVYSAVLYMLLFDGEGQPLTYLTCTSAWGSWLYFRLHYKVLLAVYHAEHVWFMNNMSVYLISYRTALASHSTSPHCPLPHPQK